jgi:hypothetical protein
MGTTQQASQAASTATALSLATHPLGAATEEEGRRGRGRERVGHELTRVEGERGDEPAIELGADEVTLGQGSGVALGDPLEGVRITGAKASNRDPGAVVASRLVGVLAPTRAGRQAVAGAGLVELARPLLRHVLNQADHHCSFSHRCFLSHVLHDRNYG